MKRFVSVLYILTSFISGFAQMKAGTWQDYLSYTNALKVADAQDKVFSATEGGLFYLDMSDNSLNKISRQDGLSDSDIRTIAWHAGLNTLLVAYSNSNIDLVNSQGVVNIGDIFRKQITGDKSINSVTFIGNEAYLSCGFGIVVINLSRREISDTYIIGIDGSQTSVFDVESYGNRLYAATATGLFSAPLEGANLLDYNNWSRIQNIPNNEGKFSHLGIFNGTILAAFTRDQWDGDEIYALKDGQWIRSYPEAPFVRELNSTSEYLVVSGQDQILIYDKSNQLIGRIMNYRINGETINRIYPQSAFINSSGQVFIADRNYGLIRMNGQDFEQNIPQGPANNSIFDLAVYNEKLWISAGGRTDVWNNQFRPPVFQELHSSEWKTYSVRQYPEMTGFFDIVQVAVNPNDPTHIAAASWGGGILIFKNEELVKKYNNLNSPLETAIPENPQEPYTRIGGISFDREGTLWVTNSQASHNLHSLSPAGEWQSYVLPEIAGFQNTVGKVLVTENGDKWVVAPRGRDIYVVNQDVSQKKYLPVTSYFNNGQQEILNRMNDVYSIAEDLSGDIWVGTSKGVAVFTAPYRIWQSSTFYAFQPSLEMGDGLYHPLLETETITAIAIDGANRKWIGTKNSGLYLISEKGDQEVLHFNVENSPLPSNTITSLAMYSTTGLLYIGTDSGLFSYQTDAPSGGSSFSQVLVYPNPVRETYDGPVTIKGLMKDTDIRITDIAGNLVHKAKSLGGQIIWDGKNLKGSRVSTGVYLIFASDSKGEETHVAKLLFIN
jgi:sugar lactone lactonase YvrE